MSENLFDAVQICPVVEEMSGERMSEHMWRLSACKTFYTCKFILYNIIYKRRINRFPLVRKEEEAVV